jgi:hypothetical protein
MGVANDRFCSDLNRLAGRDFLEMNPERADVRGADVPEAAGVESPSVYWMATFDAMDAHQAETNPNCRTWFKCGKPMSENYPLHDVFPALCQRPVITYERSVVQRASGIDALHVVSPLELRNHLETPTIMEKPTSPRVLIASGLKCPKGLWRLTTIVAKARVRRRPPEPPPIQSTEQYP